LAEAVAERPRREQQSREHDRVRIDDPLQLRSLGAEVAHDRRQSHVEIVLSTLMTTSERHKTPSVIQRR
jgi:hypothetical protein